MNLADYATRRDCWTCSELPPEIRDEINKTRRDGEKNGVKIGPDTVIRWLITEKGFDRADVKRGSLNYHFQQHHHDL